MSRVRGLLDRLLLIAAAITGALVPGFLAQYRQRLGGRLDQARLDLAPWQKLADQFFHGDLPRLIQYHLASRNPTFHAEGAVIHHLAETVQHLQTERAALQGSLFAQAAYLALHPDPRLVRATLSDWVPTFGLSAQDIVFALVLAAALWLLFQGAWTVVAAGGRLWRTRTQRVGQPPSAGESAVER